MLPCLARHLVCLLLPSPQPSHEVQQFSFSHWKKRHFHAEKGKGPGARDLLVTGSGELCNPWGSFRYFYIPYKSRHSMQDVCRWNPFENGSPADHKLYSSQCHAALPLQKVKSNTSGFPTENIFFQHVWFVNVVLKTGKVHSPGTLHLLMLQSYFIQG